MRHSTRTLCLAIATALAAGSSFAQDARTAIERAVRYIELGDFALARSYLELPLIDGRITPGERSRAYYLQGYSLEQQNFPVSAGQNYAKALAFNPNNPATLAALGHLYKDGNGVTQDDTRAADLLRRSAELGHGPGMTGLGALLLKGVVRSATPGEDLAEARRWLTRATEATSATFRTPGRDAGTAYLFLAQSYRVGASGLAASEADPQKALDYYEQALLLNEPRAFESIGRMHLNGELGAPNLGAAIEAFKRGAERGERASLVSLGYLYLTGNGLAADRTNARALFTKAADAGDLRAHHYLGYLNETSEPANTQSAIANYKVAAAGDYLPALVRLSELAFLNDTPAEGIAYLRQAAQTGDAATNNQLAWLLATSPDEELRDGAAAVSYATTAVTAKKSAATLDTLAAAYAENQQFEQAIRTQNRALALLNQQPDTDTNSHQTDFSARLATYERGEPWRAGSP